ncbi:MAG: MFS transporter [Bacillota bacterium]
MAVRSPFAALRHRNFRLYWMGQCISLIGTWMQRVAQSWLVLELTNSPFLLGVVGALQFTPIFFLALPAGAVADRVPRRKLVMVTQASAMTLAFVLGILTLTGRVTVAHIMVLATLLGVVTSFDTPARQSMIMDLVGREDILNAIALNSTSFNVARLIGPSVAGLLIAATGTGWAFVANGISFLAVLISLALMNLEEHPTPGRMVLLRDIGAGLSFISRTPHVLAVFVAAGLTSTLAMNFQTLLPVLARQEMHTGSEGFGFLLSAQGAGALTGALALAAISEGGPRPRLLWGALFAFTGLETVLGIITGPVPRGLSFPVLIPLLVAVGWSMITFTTSANSTIQVSVPPQMRGRAMSVYSMLMQGTGPLGNLIAGTLADRWGAGWAFTVGGGSSLAAALLITQWLSRVSRSMDRPCPGIHGPAQPSGAGRATVPPRRRPPATYPREQNRTSGSSAAHARCQR